MLSMETCVSPDGTVSYYDEKITCASMGLDQYHWRPEPLPHIWAWLQTAPGQVIVMLLLCTICVLVMKWKHWLRGGVEQNADAK